MKKESQKILVENRSNELKDQKKGFYYLDNSEILKEKEVIVQIVVRSKSSKII